MRLLFILLFANLLACMAEPAGEVQFRYNKKASTTPTFFHAKYLFTHDDVDDVEAAVRIEHSGSSLISMELKNITMNDPVEKIALSGSDGYYNYSGTTSGDFDGHYYIHSGNTCCEGIVFVPLADPSINLRGAKTKDLSAEEWDALVKAPAKDYFHAKYRFTHADADDVDTALRIEHSAGVLIQMELKALTPPASDPVETVALIPHYEDYRGSSSGASGGSYVVKLLADSLCCGEIEFTPTADPTLTFVGNKSEALTAAQWTTLTGGGASPASPAGGGQGGWPFKF